MRKPAILGSCLAVVLVVAACQDQATEPGFDAGRLAPARLAASVSSTVSLNRAQTTWLAPHTADRGTAINPGDYVCSESSPVSDWWLGEVFNFIDQEPATFDLLYNQLLADFVALDEPAYFESSATPQTFGYTGTFTKVMQKTERDVKLFWDIPSSDIQVLGAHGTILLNVPKVAATYTADFGVPEPFATQFAQVVHDAVQQSHVLNGGNHAIFTFNAYAAWAIGPGIPDKIVMGDAVLEGYEAVGLGDVAPKGVFAHEFAHHVQNRRGYFGDSYANAGSGAERTRYTELMADAYAGYYLTHKRGAALNRKRVEQFLQVFFQIGDCAFTNPGHHGTPNQRMASSRFGFDVADQFQQQGHILTADEFHALFVAQYPTLIAPDAH